MTRLYHQTQRVTDEEIGGEEFVHIIDGTNFNDWWYQITSLQRKYEQKKDLGEIHPNSYACLPRFRNNQTTTTDSSQTRLDLAKWIVHKDNPLTSRVAVNHLWKNLFK